MNNKNLGLLAFLLLVPALPAKAATVAEVALLKGPQRTEALLEGARKEGKIVLYSAMIEDQALRPLAAAFTRKYPFITFDHWRADTLDLITQGLAEARAIAMVADIMECGGLSQALMRAYIVQPFYTPELARYAKERYDPNGAWAATRVSYFGPAYNTKLVRAADVPKTYQDLLDPKWKGQALAWASTAENRRRHDVHHVYPKLARRGEGRGLSSRAVEAECREPAWQPARSRQPWWPCSVQGEYPIALDIFLHHPIISAQKGAPVAPMPLEPVMSNASVLLLAKAAPHPHAAMLLIDYMFSKEGQTVLRDAEYFPSDPEVEIAKGLESIVPSKAHLAEKFISEEALFNDRGKAIALQKKYFDN